MRDAFAPIAILVGLLALYGCEKSSGSSSDRSVAPRQQLPTGKVTGTSGTAAPGLLPGGTAGGNSGGGSSGSTGGGNTGGGNTGGGNTGGGNAGGGNTGSLQNAPYRTLSQGYYGGTFVGQGATSLLITDDPTWQALWAQHSSFLGTPTPAPAVDFASELIVARFIGAQGQGSSVQIVETAVDAAAGTVILRCDERPVAAGTAQALANPYHIAAVRHVPAGIQQLSLEPVDALSLTNIASGTSSGYQYGIQSFSGALMKISDAGAWATLWNQHDPLGTAPGVNFGSAAVLSAFRGYTSTSGYGLQIRSVWHNPARDELIVHTQHTTPQPGGPVGMAITNPYHIVELPSVPATTGLREVVFSTVHPTVLVEGDDSQYNFSPGFSGADLVFRDASAFASFWSQHAPGTTPPNVDFANDLVVASFLGYQTVPGGLIDVLWAVVSPPTDGYQVQIIVALPSPAPGLANTPNNPYTIVTLPKRPGPVDFQ